jgi:diguanylate cyclase (GGDEF)-like protein/PAS domain S-box-containing protein
MAQRANADLEAPPDGGFFREVLDASPTAVMVVEWRRDVWVIAYSNHAFADYTGYSSAELPELSWHQLFARENGARFDPDAGPGMGRVVLIGRRRDGTRFRCEQSVSLLTGADAVPRYVAVLRKLGAERAMQVHWRHQALHDELTGLPNRRKLDLRLARAIARAKANDTSFALLVLDLDGFKLVNDVHGHACGDEVLRTVAARLRHVLRGADLVARVGGDEFAMLIEAVPDRHYVDDVRTRLADLIEGPIMVGDTRVTVGCSVGVSWFPEHGHESRELASHADLLMYVDKRRHRGIQPEHGAVA